MTIIQQKRAMLDRATRDMPRTSGDERLFTWAATMCDLETVERLADLIDRARRAGVAR